MLNVLEMAALRKISVLKLQIFSCRTQQTLFYVFVDLFRLSCPVETRLILQTYPVESIFFRPILVVVLIVVVSSVLSQR